MEISTIISFLLAAMLLTLSPGPDILFVISTSISKGHWNGIFVTLGLSTGVLIHTMLAAGGLLLLLANSEMLFSLVQYFGAIYLLILAYKAWKERENTNLQIQLNNNQLTQKITEVKQFWKHYRTGVVMSSCNPKLIIFFLAFFPQFVNFKDENVALHIIILGTLFAFQAVIIYSIVAVISARLTNKLRQNSKIVKYLNICTAIVLAAIAISILLL